MFKGFGKFINNVFEALPSISKFFPSYEEKMFEKESRNQVRIELINTDKFYSQASYDGLQMDYSQVESFEKTINDNDKHLKGEETKILKEYNKSVRNYIQYFYVVRTLDPGPELDKEYVKFEKQKSRMEDNYQQSIKLFNK